MVARYHIWLPISEIWGTSLLRKGAEFKSPLQTLHLNFLKGTLDVKCTTTNWAVLRECGHELLQIYWFRAALLSTNSLTLRRVVEAYMCLHAHTKHCWTAEFMHAFQGLRGCDVYMQAVKNGQPICIQHFTADFRQQVRVVWQDVASVDPWIGNDRLATYKAWFPAPYADDLRAGVHAYAQNGGDPLVLPRHMLSFRYSNARHARCEQVQAKSTYTEGGV